MKTKYALLAVMMGVCSLAFFSMAINPPKQRGTDILHYMVRSSLTNAAGLTNVTGQVIISQNQQGHANNQRLDVVATGLQSNTTYQLRARLDGDVNDTLLTTFAADTKGRAVLRYKKVGSSNGQSQGKGKLPLPDVLDPVRNINELVIADLAAQPVLTADLTSPAKLMYLKKVFLTEGGVVATLRIHANTNALQFRMNTWGLVPAAPYSLVADGTVVDTGTSGTNGFLQFTNLPIVPATVINLHSISVQNGANATVISAPLP